MTTQIATIADMTIDATGNIASGKYVGRDFRVASISATGRTARVEFFGSDDAATLPTTTRVRIDPEICADCEARNWESLCDNCAARADAIGRSDSLLEAVNTITTTDTVRSILPEFAGTPWGQPMDVVEIWENHPLGKPVYARNSAGHVGAFSPIDLEIVK